MYSSQQGSSVPAGDKLIWLDLVRGISAVLVCAGHLRAVVIADHVGVSSPTALVNIFYVLTGLGHQAVIVFFVLSGFLVGGSILQSGFNFSVAKYLITRLTRLWTVLLPALLLTAIVDFILQKQIPGALTGQFRAVWHSGPKGSSDYSLSFLTLIGNLGFLQTIFVPVYGSNGPLWSLANEFWYYICFPLGIIAGGLNVAYAHVRYRVLALCVLIVTIGILPGDILLGFGIWLGGVAAMAISMRLESRRRPIKLALVLSIFCASLTYSKSQSLQNLFGINADALLGVCFAMLCVIVARWPNPSPETSLGRLQHSSYSMLSNVSFSLYLSHFPLVVGIGAIFFSGGKLMLSPYSLGVYFGLLGMLVCFGSLFWFLFERQTNMVRQAATKLIVG